MILKLVDNCQGFYSSNRICVSITKYLIYHFKYLQIKIKAGTRNRVDTHKAATHKVDTHREATLHPHKEDILKAVTLNKDTRLPHNLVSQHTAQDMAR